MRAVMSRSPQAYDDVARIKLLDEKSNKSLLKFLHKGRSTTFSLSLSLKIIEWLYEKKVIC